LKVSIRVGYANNRAQETFVVRAEFIILSVKGFVNSNSLSTRSCKEMDEVEEVSRGIGILASSMLDLFSASI